MMADTSARFGMRWLRSIRVQACALLVILVALPILILTVLGNADAERRLLIRKAVAETGDAITAGVAPMLHDLRPAEVATLREDLTRFAARDRSIKVLFRPKNAATADAFYFVATAPPISVAQTEAERQQLLHLGILPGLSQGCTAPRLLGDREASLLDNGTQVLTSAASIEGAAGCWAIVIATSESRVLGAIDASPYWQRPEVRAAVGIYAVMAALISAIFIGVWIGLLRFRLLALSPTQHAGFAHSTGIPELATVAAAFDSMVQRMRSSADMLRQAAEDNAHAFKGPIGIIRHALEPAARHASTAEMRSSLQTVSTALDRLEGLVRSARYLDSATAELLEPDFSRVDLSALVRAFVDSYATMNAARGVRLDASVAGGIEVAGQPESLEAILETLVDNASSFSPPGGTVLVRLERNDGTAIMSVSDEGPGVAADRLGRIFDRYYTYRPGGVSCQDEGAAHFGIGLWLARQNAVSLGGNIAAINRDPHGLCVTVSLPLTGK